MNAARKKQIAWWASKVQEQAAAYADVADPKRTWKNRVANKLDAISRLAKEIQHELKEGK